VGVGVARKAREVKGQAAMRAARLSGIGVTHYPPGTQPDTFTPGDFTLHRATTNRTRGGETTALGKLIQAGERVRFGNSDFARWTHSTLVVSADGDIVEAISEGVRERNISAYLHTDYMVVHVEADAEQRALARGFARSRVGDDYGIPNFISLALQSLFGWTLSVHLGGQYICSGLVARATEKCIEGYPRATDDMMPGDLAYFWGASSGEPLPPLGALGRALNLLVTFVDFFRKGRGDPAPEKAAAGTGGGARLQRVEREGDEGILRVAAGERYERWRPGAFGRYLLTGGRPQPVPSFTGIVEPAEAGKIGIACSGGGIRSAAFGLGALQVLQDKKVLKRARYLAGVSGGSYITAAFQMMRKTWTDAAEKGDNSDPGKVTDKYPPFFPGSPEEQYLRNRSSYMAQGALGKLQLVYRVLLGMTVNLVFIGAAVIAVSAPLALLYGAIFPSLRVHLEHGGLCHAKTCDFSPLVLPKWLWLALAIGAGIGVLLGTASILAYRWKQLLADITETWALRALMIFGALGLLLLVLPILLAVVRGWGAATTLHHPAGRAPHGSGAGGASATGGVIASAGGAVTLGAALLSQLRAQWKEVKQVAGEVGKARSWFEGLAPRLRTLLVYAVAAVIGPALILAVALFTMTEILNLQHAWERLLAAAGIPAAFTALYLLVDVTTWSLHSFYRRRLCSAFALKRVAHGPHDPPIASGPDGRASKAAGVAVERDYANLIELSETAITDGEWPTLLVCAAANISDTAATPPGRAVTSFTFSARAIGGPLVGAVETKHLEGVCDPPRKRYFTLPAAVAVSGAALSPSMGKMTRWPLRFLMALANVRLGVWVPNPRRLETFEKRHKSRGRPYPKPRASYLLRELLGVNSINAPYLYVTDGGHYENLGMVELLRRGCTDVYVFDASNDDFEALGDAVALARSELGVEVEIDFAPLKVNADSGCAEKICVTGKIVYPHADGVEGTLHYARLVMPPGAPADVVAYHAKDKHFPHDPTTDQLYTDQRFEAYRSLGALAASAALKPATTRPAGAGANAEAAGGPVA
jgi:hypothetical protein